MKELTLEEILVKIKAVASKGVSLDYYTSEDIKDLATTARNVIIALQSKIKQEEVINDLYTQLELVNIEKKDLEVENERLRTQQLWQPISTFPKCQDADQAGENTALLFTEQGQVVEGYWTPTGKEWIAIYYYDVKDTRIERVFNGFTPTHWKPLNKPAGY